MKRLKLICMALLIISSFPVYNIQAKDILSTKYTFEQLKNKIVTYDKLSIPKIEDREKWKEADSEILKANYDKALTMLDYTWEPIPASVTLMFVRTGNRDVYEKISFEKRSSLFMFLLAEIYENEGRFMDQILDGVWSICEESYWGVPAHLGQGHGGAGLPDVQDHYVDLFNAETACLLSWVDYIAGSKLDAISKHIRPRISYEINKRIFTPAMTWVHPWMRGNPKTGRRPNNWNPWICSNWLCTTLLIEKDTEKRAKMINRILEILDEFLSPYPEDGGCDEGPGYWNAASASLYDNLEILNFATNNAFAYVYQEEKVKNMGRYIYRAQISDSYFLNFADASPKVVPDGSLVWRFGRDIQDQLMMQFGACYKNHKKVYRGSQVFRTFFDLFYYKDFLKTEAKFPLLKDVFLPNLEVLVSRDKEGTYDGFFMAVKGGHNDESHNHNDIGNYVVFYDGLPLIIDVGSGTYTAKTFSGHRYDIWYNCSNYHNCPTINGITQSPGSQYKASDVVSKINKSYSEMKLNIACSYKSESNLKKWNRKVCLNRGKNVKVTDEYILGAPGFVINHIMTCWPVEIQSDGTVLIQYVSKDNQVKPFVLSFDTTKWKVSVEIVKMNSPEDKGIIARWGKDSIRRISLQYVNSPTKGKCEITIRKK